MVFSEDLSHVEELSLHVSVGFRSLLIVGQSSLENRSKKRDV